MLGLFVSALVGTAMAATIERPLDVQIQGQQVHVKSASYIVNYTDIDGEHVKTYEANSNTPLQIHEGKYWVDAVDLNQNTEFHLKGDNTIVLNGAVSLYPSGGIALAAIGESNLVHWKMADGRELLLNCGARFVFGGGRRPRFVKFFENQQIASGCDNVAPNTIPAASGELVQLTSSSGALDFNENGGLEYVESGYIENFTVLGQKIALAEGAEIHFHSNGRPHFFTMAQGQTLKVATVNGDLVMSNPPDTLASLSLSEDQKIDTGYLSNTLTIDGVRVGPGRMSADVDTNSIARVEIQPQTIQVSDQSYAIESRAEFDPSGKLKLIVLSAPQSVRVGSLSFEVSGQVGFDENHNVRIAQLASDTTCVYEGKNVPLFAGDALVFSETGDVVGLKPNPGHDDPPAPPPSNDPPAVKTIEI